VGTPEIAAVSLLASAAAVGFLACAVWWYTGLPHFQHRRWLKGRERMIRDFRGNLPRPPDGTPAKPPGG
jgi:hypothetical protein